MKYVYILESEAFPNQFYVGTADDLRDRLTRHNAGEVSHTSKFRPWRLKTYIAFSSPSLRDDASSKPFAEAIQGETKWTWPESPMAKQRQWTQIMTRSYYTRHTHRHKKHELWGRVRRDKGWLAFLLSSSPASEAEAAAILIRRGRFVGFLPDHYTIGWVAEGRMKAIRPDLYRLEPRYNIITRRGATGDRGSTPSSRKSSG